MIIFRQDLIHEVLKKQAKIDQYRLFMPFRLTKKEAGLFSLDVADAINFQGVPLIPSGQRPVMWPRMSWVYRREQLEEWSNHLIDQACELEKKLKSNPEAPAMRVALREMPSLAELGVEMYPKYKTKELDIFIPKKM
jgi:hypothetical protein